MKMMTFLINWRLCIVISCFQILLKTKCSSAVDQRDFWDDINNKIDGSTESPSTFPTLFPSSYHTIFPTSQPSPTPTRIPSNQPSAHPSAWPSIHASSQPSWQPSAWPSMHPSVNPTIFPSTQPSAQPTDFPSIHPSHSPSPKPSSFPSLYPTESPSIKPTQRPSHSPSSFPTLHHTNIPSEVQLFKSPSFSVKLSLSISRGGQQNMDSEEIATFEETTLDFATECPLNETPAEAVENMATKVSSQKWNGSLLEVDIVITGNATSQKYADDVSPQIIICFRDDYESLTARLQVSLASGKPGSPSGREEDKNLNVIFLCVGISSGVIVGVAIVLALIRRRKKQSIENILSKHDNFDVICEPRPQLYSFSADEGESGQKTHARNNIPPLSKVKVGDILATCEEGKTPDVPTHIGFKVKTKHENDMYSKKSAISSVTDMNRYYRTGGQQERYDWLKFENDGVFDSDQVKTEKDPRTTEADPIPNDEGESMTTSMVSSGILMGLNIPLQTAYDAKNIPIDIVNGARELESFEQERERVSRIDEAVDSLDFIH